MAVRQAKTQISLGIRPVWSESSLSPWRKLGSLATHWAHSEDSYQTGPMPRLIWVFAGRTVILLVLSWCGSNIGTIKSFYHSVYCLQRIWKTANASGEEKVWITKARWFHAYAMLYKCETALVCEDERDCTTCFHICLHNVKPAHILSMHCRCNVASI